MTDAPAAEGAYERERRVRMEANQAELDRLGLGAISISMPGTRPAPTPAATKRKALQPVVPRGVPQRRAAAGAMEEIAKLLDETSRTDENGELLRERQAPVVIPTAADSPAAAGRGGAGAGAGRSASAAPKKRARVQLTEPIVHWYLDSFTELCECRNNVQLEGLYLGLWYRAAVTGADGAGAHLLYLDSEDTEVLGPADFERRSWRVRGGGRGDEEARSSDLSPQEEREGGGASTSAGQSDPHGAVGRVPGWGADNNHWEVVWEVQLARLAAYKVVHGDCNVPTRWAEDPRLGGWVNHQRALKQKLDRGEPSKGMTAERAARLTALGFAWGPNEAEWEAQLARLAAYKVVHGDCNVPKCWAEDRRLGGWVTKQRTLKRQLDRGEPSSQITAERVARLTALGLAWNLRRVS
jgi:hypothetical protein